jgi:hypothetical protein
VALPPRRFAGRFAARYHPGPHLPGEAPLNPSEKGTTVDLRLSLEEAEALHLRLEDLLEREEDDPRLGRAYRVLGWRILAARGGTGLTGRLASIAREAGSVEEYEAKRDEALGPILEGLERGENRDP